MIVRLPANTAMFLAAALAVSTAMMAAEPANSPDGPIESAKRDFEAVKSKGGVDPRQKLSPLFEHAAPALEGPSDTPTILSPIQRARKIEQSKAGKGTHRSSTWLLDAMQAGDKQDAAGSVRKSTGNDGDHWKESSLLDLNFSNRSGPATEEGKSAHREDLRSSKGSFRTEIHNPLDDYMSKWMSSRDLELLKATRSTVQATPLSPSPIRQDLELSTFSPAASDSFDRVLSSLTLHVAGGGVHNENRYLGDLSEQLTVGSQSPAPPFAGLGPMILVPASPKPAIVEPAQPIPSPTKPSLAESLRAKDDAGLFRQLKRF